jgi:hypothetical protein
MQKPWNAILDLFLKICDYFPMQAVMLYQEHNYPHFTPSGGHALYRRHQVYSLTTARANPVTGSIALFSFFSLLCSLFVTPPPCG